MVDSPTGVDADRLAADCGDLLRRLVSVSVADPVGRTNDLFEFRRAEMENQSRIWGDAAIKAEFEVLTRTWDMLEVRYSATGKFLVKAGIRRAEDGEPERRGAGLRPAIRAGRSGDLRGDGVLAGLPQSAVPAPS